MDGMGLTSYGSVAISTQQSTPLYHTRGRRRIGFYGLVVFFFCCCHYYLSQNSLEQFFCHYSENKNACFGALLFCASKNYKLVNDSSCGWLRASAADRQLYLAVGDNYSAPMLSCRSEWRVDPVDTHTYIYRYDITLWHHVIRHSCSQADYTVTAGSNMMTGWHWQTMTPHCEHLTNYNSPLC